MPVRIAIADDHRMVREALAGLLAGHPDLEIVGEAGDGRGALAMVEGTAPDLLLLDFGLPDMKGMDACRQIRSTHPQVRVIAVSAHADRRFVEEMLQAGAAAYVVKADAASELVKAIRAVAAGGTFISPRAAAALDGPSSAQNGGNAPPPATCLGRREREVLTLIAEGERSASIAARLGIATATVELHRRNIMRKLGLHNVAELTKYALREGLAHL